MITALLITAAAIALLRHRKTRGVGLAYKVRKNPYVEISWLQESGVEFGKSPDDLTQEEFSALATAYRNWRKPKENSFEPETLAKYYKQLNSVYKRLTHPAIGRINYPYETHRIHNANGDVIVEYHDYNPERDLSDAIAWWKDINANNPYLYTIGAIADGTKWIWKGKKQGGQLLTRGIADEIVFSGGSTEATRRAYKALISKNGWTIDKWAERWLDNPDAKNGVLDALREFNTPQSARDYILGQYYQQFDTPDAATDFETDLPF